MAVPVDGSVRDRTYRRTYNMFAEVDEDQAVLRRFVNTQKRRSVKPSGCERALGVDTSLIHKQFRRTRRTVPCGPDGLLHIPLSILEIRKLFDCCYSQNSKLFCNLKLL